MRFRHVAAPIVAVGLAASGSAGARDKSILLTAQLGGSYMLSTNLNAASASNSLFGLQLNLGISGGYFNPRLLRWTASANYDLLRGALFNAPNALDRLGYRATALLLGGTPLNVDLLATRYFTDSTAQRSAGGAAMGNTTTSLYGGTVSYTGLRLPSARIGWSHQDSTTVRQGQEPADSSSTRLSLGVSQALTRFEYGINYNTSWNSGTFTELNYQGHSLMVNMAAPLSEGIRLNLFDNYYLRRPTTDASTNPRYDSNSLGGGLRWRHDKRQSSWLDYAYNHDLVETPTQPVIERTVNRLGASTRRLISDSVFFLGNLGGTFARTRLGDVRREALDQSLALGAEWQGTYAWGAALASGTALLGLVEPTAGAVRFTHGVTASGVYSRGWSRLVVTSVQYLVSYNNGSALVDGWTLTQQGRLEGNWRIDPKSRFRGQFTAYSSRRNDRVQGVFLGRNLSLVIEYTSGNYSSQISGGLGDGLADALANPVSDGLFLPVAFNTHSRYATLGGSAAFDRGRLLLTANARLGELVAPGRLSTLEGGFQLLASYTVGKFVISAEERFAAGGPGTSRQQTNLVMLRLTRSFSWQIGDGG